MMSEEIQRINLNDYIQTGDGGTALTYTRKDGLSLAKLYKPGFEADRAKADSQSPLHVRHDFQRPHARRSLAKNRQIVLAD